MKIVYFSGATNNTHRFVAKLGDAAQTAARIPLTATAEPLKIDEPFVLITSTYGGGGRDEDRHAVPKQVIRFLNDPDNRSWLRGVIASGNMNFGRTYCRAGEIISRKCDVPLLHRFEILGTPEDVQTVNSILEGLNAPRH
jgi:protein involved in ribonucleotide reduction